MNHESHRLQRTFTVRLERGDDILVSLREIVERERIQQGVIVTGYGSIERGRYHRVTIAQAVPRDEFIDVEGPLEVLSISGWIMDGVIHSHIVLANGDQALGGHLEEGCRVLTLCHLVITELSAATGAGPA